MASLVERSLPEGSRDGQSVRAGVDRLRKVYAARACLLTRPYEGISELLGELTQRRIARGVLSNKPHDLTVALVAELLGEWGMDPVLGERAEVPCKPDPTAAFEAAALLGVAPTEILFVGDTPTDMETAKRAGMRPIGVAWGFRPTSELVHAGAFAIVTHPQQILSYLD